MGLATLKHHKKGRPFCPYCGSFNVKELNREGTAEHRHVCLAYDCVETARKIREREREFLNRPVR